MIFLFLQKKVIIDKNDVNNDVLIKEFVNDNLINLNKYNKNSFLIIVFFYNVTSFYLILNITIFFIIEKIE